MNDAENAGVYPLVIVRRGFIDELRGPLQSCLDHLPQLVWHRAACLTRVRVTDREPVAIEDRRIDWSWVIHPSEDQLMPVDERPHFLRREIWDELEGYITTPSARVRAKRYRTRELAEAALSDALLHLAWK